MRKFIYYLLCKLDNLTCDVGIHTEGKLLGFREFPFSSNTSRLEYQCKNCKKTFYRDNNNKCQEVN